MSEPIPATAEPALRAATPRERISTLVFAWLGVMLIVFLYWAKLPVALAFDPNAEKCLPDMHLSLMVYGHTGSVHDGDLVFWKPAGELAYVKQEVVMKMVAAVPGDRLQIVGDRILVNGRLVTSGLALASLYKKSPESFARDEIVPPGRLFVVGLHPNSDDSRYWGYLEQRVLQGFAVKLL